MRNPVISHLLDEYLALAEGERNRRLLSEVWERPNLAYMDDVGVPKPGAIPILAVPQISMWARKMGRSVARLFTDPQTYLEVFVQREIDRFKEIRDDRPLNRKIVVALGAGFESALFGAKQQYSDTDDPWVDRTHVITTPSDLDKLGLPDFRSSGLMPLAHRFSEELAALVDGYPIEIMFPDWIRSPFGVAVQLRGLDTLLMDMLDQPDFVDALLSFLTTSAMRYRSERADFLGIAPDPPLFHNDDVNVPTLSARMYRERILPAEKMYARSFGGLTYWHSCGDVTPMLDAVREIDDIAILHVGPWTDIARAADLFGGVTLDICLHSEDVYRTGEQATRARIRSIVRTCREHGARSFSIRPGILQAFGDMADNVRAIVAWTQVAKQAIAEEVRP